MIAAWRLFSVGLLVGRASGFPVGILSTNQAIFDKLQSGGSGRDGLATALLLPALKDIFKQARYQILVEKGDLVVQGSFPDTQIDDDCHHKIDAEHPKATGTIEKSSYLRFGFANISWRGSTVFADSELDSKLDISTDVCVRVGEEIFGHHCSQVARKTVGIDVLSDGQTGIGINLTASNAHVAQVNGTWSLVFNFHASIVGKVLKWDIEKVAANNCKIKILGITIASVCGTIERHVKDKAQTLTDRVMAVTSPNILRKLEDTVNAKIGSVVVIPLRIGARGSTATPSDGEIVV